MDEPDKTNEVPSNPLQVEEGGGEHPSSSPTTEEAKEFELLRQQMTQLLEEFQSKLKYDRHKEKTIDNLHRELQQYKGDLLQKLLRPVILDIVHLADDVEKLVANHSSHEPSQLDPTKLLRLLKQFPSDLEDILYRQGVEPFTETVPTFNPARQKVLRTVPTDDRERDKTVARSLRNGYEWEGKVLRPQMVEVYVYRDRDTDSQRNSDE